MDESELGVVVAVGPGGIGDGALDYAAAAAARLGTGIELFHVVHTLVVAPAEPDEMSNLDESLSEVGRKALTDAAERLRERLTEGQRMSTEILSGPVTRTIVERGARGSMVVIQRRDRGRLERLLTSSVSSGVAAHAAVPVVVVPPHWKAIVDDDRPVTVGVDHPGEASEEVPVALAYAARAGAPCVVLHAAWLPEAYQDTIFVGHPRKQWVAEARAALHQALEALHASQPDAELTTQVTWTRPVEALVDATRTSQLLVLNRRTPEHPLGAHLGPVARAVLHHAECPVLVADRIVGPTHE